MVGRSWIAAQAEIKVALAKQKIFYEKRRREIEFNVDDKVYFDDSSLPTLADPHSIERSPKLRSKFVGQFTIVQVSSPLPTTTWNTQLPKLVPVVPHQSANAQKDNT
ncbi:hypothetical protein DICA0_F00122 [Diutina catenulata]